MKIIDGKPMCDPCVSAIRMTSKTLQPLSLRSPHKRNVSDTGIVGPKHETTVLARSSGSSGLSMALGVREVASSERMAQSSGAIALSPRMTGKLTGAQALLKWCQKRTDYKYKGVDLGNWKQAWQNGLGFCALAHHFFNTAIDFDSLKAETREDKLANCALAFKVFDEQGNGTCRCLVICCCVVFFLF